MSKVDGFITSADIQGLCKLNLAVMFRHVYRDHTSLKLTNYSEHQYYLLTTAIIQRSHHINRLIQGNAKITDFNLLYEIELLRCTSNYYTIVYQKHTHTQTPHQPIQSDNKNTWNEHLHETLGTLAHETFITMCRRVDTKAIEKYTLFKSISKFPKYTLGTILNFHSFLYQPVGTLFCVFQKVVPAHYTVVWLRVCVCVSQRLCVHA